MRNLNKFFQVMKGRDKMIKFYDKYMTNVEDILIPKMQTTQMTGDFEKRNKKERTKLISKDSIESCTSRDKDLFPDNGKCSNCIKENK